MQTFLPVADFEDGARLLDSPRLGKQRVETLQILRALELPDYGWASHPAVLMWRGRTPALVAYGLAMVRIWRERGFADSTETLIGVGARRVPPGLPSPLPSQGSVMNSKPWGALGPHAAAHGLTTEEVIRDVIAQVPIP